MDTVEEVNNNETNTQSNDQIDNILIDIKKLIGLLEEDDSFDVDVLININNAIDTLWELGVINKPYNRVQNDTTWTQIFGNECSQLDMIKTYIYLKTKLIFDPPLNASLLESLRENIRETEYRLNISYDPEKL